MNQHKRYLLFAYDMYYPSGGLDDLAGSFDTIEEANQAAIEEDADYSVCYDRIEGVPVVLPINHV